LIYVDSGKVGEYAAWVKTLDFVAVTDADLDNDFESALKQFEQNNNKQTISGLWLIMLVSQEVHALKANFYLAQAYFAGDKKDKSIANYTYVINEPRSEFTRAVFG
jgi:hypothetical protein